MQSSTAWENYLSTDVNTAAPQKLQLLLIEAALRLANRAGQFWKQGRGDAAIGALIQAQSIVAEILGSMDREVGGDLSLRVSAVYEFIYRSLVDAGYRRNEKSLGDAVRILEIERETWRRLCDKLGAEGQSAIYGPAHQGIARSWAGDADSPASHFLENGAPGGFSLDA
jgi:flagellar secretion chaperone FliS